MQDSLFSQFPIYLCAFMLSISVVNLIPELFTAYRERYQVSSRRTARELSKFFIDIKPTKILLGAALLAGLAGFAARSWVPAAGVLIAGAFAPKIILSLAKDIRSSKFEAQ